MYGDIATMGAMIGAGLATFGMGGAAIGVGIIVGAVLKVMHSFWFLCSNSKI